MTSKKITKIEKINYKKQSMKEEWKSQDLMESFKNFKTKFVIFPQEIKSKSKMLKRLCFKLAQS